MNAKTRETMTSSVRQNYGTPGPFYDWVNYFSRVTVDVCAEDWNAKHKRFYTKRVNGLAQEWRNDVWWNNCEYDCVEDWAPYSQHEARMGGAGLCLVASRPDTEWFRNATENGMGPLVRSYFVPETRVWWAVWRDVVVGIYHHHQRLMFDAPPGAKDKRGNPVKMEKAPFPSSLIIHAARAHRRRVDFWPAPKLSTPFGLPALTWRMPE